MKQKLTETLRVITEMRICAVTWQRDACLMGNVTAGEIADTCEEVTNLIEKVLQLQLDASALSKTMAIEDVSRQNP